MRQLYLLLSEPCELVNRAPARLIAPRPNRSAGAAAARACRLAFRLTGGGLAERRLRGGKSRDRHAERRAGNIVEPDLMADSDRSWIATMFAANADLELGACLAPAL